MAGEWTTRLPMESGLYVACSEDFGFGVYEVIEVGGVFKIRDVEFQTYRDFCEIDIGHGIIRWHKIEFPPSVESLQALELEGV